MAFVEVGTGAIGREIEIVVEVGSLPVRGIVEGVAVCVSDGQGEGRDGATNGNLQGIVNGVGRVGFEGDRSVANEGAERRWIVAAGGAEIDRSEEHTSEL